MCNAGCKVTFKKLDEGKSHPTRIQGHHNRIVDVNLQEKQQARPISQPCIRAINEISNNIPKPPLEVELMDSLQLAVHALKFMMQTTGPKEVLHNLIKISTATEIAMFYCQVLCSPPKSTLLKAIKNKQLVTFPGLTYELIK